MRNVRAAPMAVLLLLAGGSAAAGQAPRSDPARALMTRGELHELLRTYEQAARSPAYSADLRSRARYEASLIRARLEEGDFQTGDRIWLQVEGEPALTDTFVVGTDRALALPTVGTIPLKGILRSELEDHLVRELGQYLREPRLRARALIRISVFGEILAPGFYVAPVEVPLTDALMLAGGPTRDAKLDDIRIERSGRRIWGGDALQSAIVEGRTLDQLNLRAGDRIVVPRQTRFNVGEVLRVSLFALPPLIFALTQAF